MRQNHVALCCARAKNSEMLPAKDFQSIWGQHHRHCQNSCTDHICHNDSCSQKYLRGPLGSRFTEALRSQPSQPQPAIFSPGHAVVAKQFLQIAILWINPRNTLQTHQTYQIYQIYQIPNLVSPSHYSKIECSWILRSTWLPHSSVGAPLIA